MPDCTCPTLQASQALSSELHQSSAVHAVANPAVVGASREPSLINMALFGSPSGIAMVVAELAAQYQGPAARLLRFESAAAATASEPAIDLCLVCIDSTTLDPLSWAFLVREAAGLPEMAIVLCSSDTTMRLLVNSMALSPVVDRAEIARWLTRFGQLLAEVARGRRALRMVGALGGPPTPIAVTTSPDTPPPVCSARRRTSARATLGWCSLAAAAGKRRQG